MGFVFPGLSGSLAAFGFPRARAEQGRIVACRVAACGPGCLCDLVFLPDLVGPNVEKSPPLVGVARGFAAGLGMELVVDFRDIHAIASWKNKECP